MGLFSRSKTPAKEERSEITFDSGIVSQDNTLTESESALLTAVFGSGLRVNADIAMQIPAVAHCVNMIAGAVAMLPVKLYRKADGKSEEITDDIRLKLLNLDTGDTMNADQMRYMWVRDYLLTGSAYAYIGRRYGDPRELHYVGSKYVSVEKDTSDVIFKKYRYLVNGKMFHPFEFLKILRNTDGFGRGRGVIQDNPLVVDMAYNYLKFQRVQLLKGGNKKGFLQTTKTVTGQALDILKAQWSQLYSNNENTEKVMILNDGVQFKEISNTAVEMQLAELAKKTDEQIFSLFGTSDGTLSEDTIKNAIMPVLDSMEAAFDSDLLSEAEKGDYYFAFDTRELTRGDINQRYQAYATALSQNFMQLDEVRALEDLPPLGVNFIKLGLNDVLLDPKTGTIYTPNTNAFANMGESVSVPLTDEENRSIIENRGWVTIKGRRVLLNKDSGGGGGSAQKTEKEKDLEYLPQAIKYSKEIKNSVSALGTTIKGMSCHAARRMSERNVAIDNIRKVLRDPDKTYPSEKHKNATMYRDPETLLSLGNNGIVITVVNLSGDD